MRFRNTFLLFFLTCFLFNFVQAQDKKAPSPPPMPTSIEEGSVSRAVIETLTLRILVWSKETGYLKNLNREDFEFYVGKKKRKIELFSIEPPTYWDKEEKKFKKEKAIKGTYWIGVEATEKDKKRLKRLKLKVRLSREKRKEVGKVRIKVQRN